MDDNIRSRRQKALDVIDEKAAALREKGESPFKVQRIRSAARQEVARALPDFGKYGQAVNLATQYTQKKAT